MERKCGNLLKDFMKENYFSMVKELYHGAVLIAIIHNNWNQLVIT